MLHAEIFSRPVRRGIIMQNGDIYRKQFEFFRGACRLFPKKHHAPEVRFKKRNLTMKYLFSTFTGVALLLSGGSAYAGPPHHHDGVVLATQIVDLVKSVLLPPLILPPSVTTIVTTPAAVSPGTVTVQSGGEGVVIVEQPACRTYPTVIYQERSPVIYYDYFSPPLHRPLPPPPPPKPYPEPPAPRPPRPDHPGVRPPLKYPVAPRPGHIRPDPDPGRYQRLPVPSQKYRHEVPTYAPAPPRGQWQQLPPPSRNYRTEPARPGGYRGGQR